MLSLSDETTTTQHDATHQIPTDITTNSATIIARTTDAALICMSGL